MEINHPQRSKRILKAVITWIVRNTSESKKKKLVQWFTSGNIRTGTEYRMKIKRQLRPFLPILLKCNGDVTFTDENQKTILHHCISHMKPDTIVESSEIKHDQTLVSMLERMGASIIADDCNGNTPLGIVLEKNRIDLLSRFLLYDPASLNYFNNLGQSFLHILFDKYTGKDDIYRSYYKIISGFSGKQVFVSHVDKQGVTPMHLAVKIFDFRLFEVIERRFPALLYLKTNLGDDLLIIACKNIIAQTDESKVLNFIKRLLKLGFDVNSRNKNNFSPLHYASQSDNLRVIETLIDAGSDLHAEANDNTNVLHSATMSSNFKIMQYFIERRVNFVRRDKVYGFSLIHMSAFSSNVKNLEWLIGRGFDQNDLSNCGLTPLHLASMIGNSEIVKKLIEHGANVHFRVGKDQYTALHLASMGGQFATIQNINASKIDTKKFDDDSSLVSHCFNSLKTNPNHESDYKATVTALLKAGADINAKDNYNRTSLHYVTLQSDGDFVSLLLKAGANIDVQDLEGHTPLHNRLFSGNGKGLQALLMFGANINDIEQPNEDIFDVEFSDNSVETRILKHTIKLDLAELYINDEFRKILASHKLEDFYEEYCEELIKLIKWMLTPYVSLYDLLHMNFRRRVTFTDRLPFKIETEFPHYYILIRGKCNEALNRISLVDEGKAAFQLVTGFQWPDVCMESIFSFLSNSYLNVLIDSAKL